MFRENKNTLFFVKYLKDWHIRGKYNLKKYFYLENVSAGIIHCWDSKSLLEREEVEGRKEKLFGI